MFDEDFCRKYVYRMLFILLAVISAYLFVKYVFPLTAPFVIAFGVAFAVRPFKMYLCKKLKLRSSFAAAVSVLVILGSFLYLFFRLAKSIFSELASIYAYLTAETDIYNKLVRSVTLLVDRIADRIDAVFPFVNIPTLSPSDRLEALAGKIIPPLTGTIGKFLADAASSVPYAFVFLAITVVASFYFAADLERICGFFSRLMPRKWTDAAARAKNGMFKAGVKYARAYLFLIFVTFTELSIGFSLLKLDYVFSLAFVISIIDILPVLGTGTVLVPWAVISFATGNSYMGVGILTLYIVITVVRQFIEPRIVGGSIGLYPPLALIGMYVGAKLFGVAGLFLLPLAIVAAKNVLESVPEEG